MKFSSAEPKFERISLGKILSSTRKTRFYISLACFGRGLFRPRVISICGSFYPESKTWQTKTNECQGSFFLFIYFKDKKEHSSECHFSKKKMKVIGFRGGGGR